MRGAVKPSPKLSVPQASIHPTPLSLSLNQQQISNDKLSNVQATLLQEKGEGMASSPYAIFNPHLQIPGFDLGPWPRCLVALKTIYSQAPGNPARPESEPSGTWRGRINMLMRCK